MLDGYRFRLYPNVEQQQTLGRWLGYQRQIDNAKVQENRYFRRFVQGSVETPGDSIPMGQQYSRFITERTRFLRAVPPEIVRNGATKFAKAYQRFFKHLGGLPKLRKKSGRQAVWQTKPLGQFLPEGNTASGTTPEIRWTSVLTNLRWASSLIRHIAPKPFPYPCMSSSKLVGGG